MSGDQELIFNMIACPDCKHEFYPIAKPLEEFDSKATAPKSTKPENQSPENLKSSTRKIAEIFSIIAGVLSVIGVVSFLFTLKNSISEMKADVVGWVTTGAFFSSALWIFTVAQIVHIRANTEK
jgi:hypothetical protein